MVAGSDIVAFGLAQRGKPYQWGAAGPNRYDCSGLVYDAAKHSGLTVPRTTSDMIGSKSNLIGITRDKLQAGDLIFSNWGDGKSSHVGIYTGDGNLIEAPQPGKTVTVTKLDESYWNHTDNFRRIPGVDGAGTPTDTGGLVGNIATTVGAGISGIVGMIPTPGNVTDALTNIGTAMASAASGIQSVGGVATNLARLFIPSNLLRAWALVMGTIFVFIGIWFLAREIKDSS